MQSTLGDELCRIIFYPEDADDASKIINDPNFNPNEVDGMGEPLILSLMYLATSYTGRMNEKTFNLLRGVIRHKDFNPNLTDKYCETPLMAIAREDKLNGLIDDFISLDKIDINATNDLGYSALRLAQLYDNAGLFQALIKSEKLNLAVQGLPVKSCSRHVQ